MLRTGAIGAGVAAICCFTSFLVVLLGFAGLSSLVGGIDYILFPIMFASMGLTAYALYLRSGSPGSSPRTVIIVLVVALSTLLFWLEFKYALRISIAAAVMVAAYALYLRATTKPEAV